MHITVWTCGTSAAGPPRSAPNAVATACASSRRSTRRNGAGQYGGHRERDHHRCPVPDPGPAPRLGNLCQAVQQVPVTAQVTIDIAVGIGHGGQGRYGILRGSVGTVKSRLTAARTALNGILNKKGQNR